MCHLYHASIGIVLKGNWCEPGILDCSSGRLYICCRRAGHHGSHRRRTSSFPIHPTAAENEFLVWRQKRKCDGSPCQAPSSCLHEKEQNWCHIYTTKIQKKKGQIMRTCTAKPVMGVVQERLQDAWSTKSDLRVGSRRAPAPSGARSTALCSSPGAMVRHRAGTRLIKGPWNYPKFAPT